MAGRGPQTFKKRQKEQARKEKQLEKRAKKLERKQSGPEGENPEAEEDFSDYTGGDFTLDRDGHGGVEGERGYGVLDQSSLTLREGRH